MRTQTLPESIAWGRGWMLRWSWCALELVELPRLYQVGTRAPKLRNVTAFFGQDAPRPAEILLRADLDGLDFGGAHARIVLASRELCREQQINQPEIMWCAKWVPYAQVPPRSAAAPITLRSAVPDADGDHWMLVATWQSVTVHVAARGDWDSPSGRVETVSRAAARKLYRKLATDQGLRTSVSHLTYTDLQACFKALGVPTRVRAPIEYQHANATATEDAENGSVDIAAVPA